MVHQQKIITMTKLALYDKHEGAADRAANDYFRHDYIYRKNLGTRLSVGLAGLVILLIYWLRVIFLDGVDILELYIQHHVRESILFILAIMAVYSLIGTIQGTREYYLIQKRLERYQGMMRFLERVDERGRIRVADDERPNMDTKRTRHTSRRPNLGEQPEGRPRRVPPEGGARQSETRQRPLARPDSAPPNSARPNPVRPGSESLVHRGHSDAYGGTPERPAYRRTEVSRRTEERLEKGRLEKGRLERPRQQEPQPLVRLKRPSESGD